MEKLIPPNGNSQAGKKNPCKDVEILMTLGVPLSKLN